MAWACKKCPDGKLGTLHPYTRELMRIRMLQKGGFPFARTDLPIETWEDLGYVNTALDQKISLF